MGHMHQLGVGCRFDSQKFSVFLFLLGNFREQYELYVGLDGLFVQDDHDRAQIARATDGSA